MEFGPNTGVLLHAALAWGGLLLAVLGLFGLVRARLSDRRWAALYVLCLTAVTLASAFLLLLGGFNAEGLLSGWWHPFLAEYLTITIAGLIGTGVSLC